jgi:hypothetical protein
MTADPRAALATFVSALERHLEAAAARRGERDPVVVAAYQDVAEAFDAYDDALLDAFDEVTPLEVYHEGVDDEDDDDLDEDDDLEDEDDESDDEDDDESDDDESDDEDDSDDASDDDLDDLGDDREGGAGYQGLDEEDYDDDGVSR